MSPRKPLVSCTTAMREAMERAMLCCIKDTGSLPTVMVEGANVSKNAGVKKRPSWCVTRKHNGKT